MVIFTFLNNVLPLKINLTMYLPFFISFIILNTSLDLVFVLAL